MGSEPTKSRISPNKLSGGQIVRLHAWLMANKDLIIQSGFTYMQIAMRATETLGFEVIPPHIMTLRNELNIDWLVRKVRAPADTSRTVERRRAMRILTENLVNLYSELTGDVPSELKALLIDLHDGLPVKHEKPTRL